MTLMQFPSFEEAAEQAAGKNLFYSPRTWGMLKGVWSSGSTLLSCPGHVLFGLSSYASIELLLFGIIFAITFTHSLKVSSALSFLASHSPLTAPIQTHSKRSLLLPGVSSFCHLL